MLRRTCLCASLMLTIAFQSFGQKGASLHPIASLEDSTQELISAIHTAVEDHLLSNNLQASDLFRDFSPVWSLSELSEASEYSSVLILPLLAGPDSTATSTILLHLSQRGQLKYVRFDSTEQHDFLGPYFQNKAWHTVHETESILRIRTYMLSPFFNNYFLFIEGNTHHRWFTPEGMDSRDTTHAAYEGFEWRPMFIHLAIADWEQHTLELEGPFATDFYGRIRPVPIFKHSSE